MVETLGRMIHQVVDSIKKVNIAFGVFAFGVDEPRETDLIGAEAECVDTLARTAFALGFLTQQSQAPFGSFAFCEELHAECGSLSSAEEQAFSLCFLCSAASTCVELSPVFKLLPRD